MTASWPVRFLPANSPSIWRRPGWRSSNKVPGSKIRRDPPPPVKELEIVDIERRDARTVVLGILTFALALVVIAIALMS